MKSSKSDVKNGQLLLFSETEMDAAQDKLKDIYREEFERSIYVFVDDEDDDGIPEVIPEVKCLGLMQKDLNTFDPEELKKIESEAEEKRAQIRKQAEADILKAVKDAQKKMDLPYFEHPKNDGERLMNYQHDFIVNDSADAWCKLYELATKVAKILLWEWLRDHPGEFLDEISQDEKVSIAVEYVLRRYKYRVGWYARDNYIGVLKGGIIHAMCYITEIDKATDYVEDVNIARAKST